MKTKKETNRILKLGLLLTIPAVMALVTFTSCGNTGKPGENQTKIAPPPPPPPPPVDEKSSTEMEPFTVVEEMPVFPGGDVELLKFIGKETIYPENAKKNGIQGRVIVRFCVTEKGDVTQVSIIQGVGPELDAEAMRVVKLLPAFTPGKQKGIAVPVWYTVPISFKLT
jgi:protein TonB